jgi:hypothetical protein
MKRSAPSPVNAADSGTRLVRMGPTEHVAETIAVSRRMAVEVSHIATYQLGNGGNQPQS